ncbi:MAG TPA: type VI secretion system baseplate subunit TssF [Polyangiales bacterium]|nr:type VI secretion system baseplate subunit TssF [Polyangiales bacterium]
MDPRFYRYYERELKHVREMGGEFAREFPKTAERIGLQSFECDDPYVERLIESFAFLTARVQLKLDAEYPQFTQQMLELLYPGYLAPTPSMTVVQLQPNPRQGSLTGGVTVPRGSSLRSRYGQTQTPCEYRTAHPVQLLPIELVSASYRSALGEGLEGLQVPPTKAVLKVVLRTTGGQSFAQLPLAQLPLYLRGADIAPLLYENFIRANVGLVVRSVSRPAQVLQVTPARCMRALGFADDEALLPCGNEGFHGHRLLQEYFAFPERFMFVALAQLTEGLSRCHANSVELVFLFDQLEPRLEGVVEAAHLALFCTPAINLFPRASDRIPLNDRDHECHVVPDRTRPSDFEVHTVTRVVGYGSGSTGERIFLPMHASPPEDELELSAGYFSVRRQPKMISQDAREVALRSSYVPSETFLSLVDGAHGPFDKGLRQLAVSTLCTNRALPLQMGVGRGDSDFSEQSGAPVQSVRCLAGPTPPLASPVHGELAWRILSHLGLDYLSVMREGAAKASLRELLSLYSGYMGPAHRKQVDGVTNVATKSVVRPLPFAGPIAFGRGIEVTLTCDENAFEGTGVFVFASVLERFFAKYASINSFAQTVLRTQQRGEVMRWPTTAGRRNIL